MKKITIMKETLQVIVGAMWHYALVIDAWLRRYLAKSRVFSRWLTEKLYIKSPWKRWTVGAASTFMSFAVAFGALLFTTVPDWEETAQIWNIKGEYSLTFLDSNGVVIGFRGGHMDTKYELDDFPPHLIEAVLNTEDRRFYSHNGIDPMGIVGAVLHNMSNPSAREKGGSTITQQVVKNIWLTPERSLKRKITEAWLAMWLENHSSKDEILKLYFERAYMGAGNYGLAAASQYYFGKPITDVTLSEAAMLAGLFKAPVNYSPSSNYGASLERSRVVLASMRDNGLIDDKEYWFAINHPPNVIKQDPKPTEWLLDYAYLESIKLIRDRHLTHIRNFTVRTTVDSDLQAHAEWLLKNAIEQNGKEYDASQAALVSLSIDGGIKALVGGLDYSNNQFNRAINAKRQPGSSFKPFVYLTAALNGWNQDTRVVDEPITLTVFGKAWSPSNYKDEYYGSLTLKEAYAKSLNTIAVKIMQKFGREAIIKVAHDAGIKSKLEKVHSLPLGSEEVSLLELTNAYTTFAADGRFQPAYVIRSLESARTVLYTHDQDFTNNSMVFPNPAVREMVKIMHYGVEYGTGKRAVLDVPVAGKTGTTSDYRDAWFIGYTGNAVTGVWFGNDDNHPMNKMTGGTIPAQVWHDFMVRSEAKDTPKGLPGIPYVAPPLDPVSVIQDAPKPRKKKKVVDPQVQPEQPEPLPETVPKQPEYLFDKIFGKKND